MQLAPRTTGGPLRQGGGDAASHPARPLDTVPSALLWGAVVVDITGHLAGHVVDVSIDAATGRPVWLTIARGLLARRSFRCPATLLSIESGRLVLAVSNETVLRYCA